VDAAVRRILRAKFRSGIFDGKPPLDPAREIESPAHLALAREAAAKSIVLLKNDGALPLARATVRQVAVVGALAATANTGDTGSSATASSHVVTPIEGIRALAPGVNVVDLSRDVLTADDEALVTAADAAIVVVGLTAADEGESILGAGDRKGLALSAAHEALVARVAALHPRTVVVLEGSGAVLVEGFQAQVPAILLAWYPGMEGGTALAGVLFGDVNPSGKLPVSFPRAESQLPPFVNDEPTVVYGYLHGYRHLDAAGAEPRFPFGFGLSYTSFSFANLRLDPVTSPADGTVRATVDVTNQGAVAGDEVLQLYVSYPGSAVARAVRELKGFARVSLAPGETRTVVMDLRVKDLAWWDVTRAGLVVEPLSYVVEVGNSSRNLPLSARLVVPAG
jgi:beta-glucosidase